MRDVSNNYEAFPSLAAINDIGWWMHNSYSSLFTYKYVRTRYKHPSVVSVSDVYPTACICQSTTVIDLIQIQIESLFTVRKGLRIKQLLMEMVTFWSHDQRYKMKMDAGETNNRKQQANSKPETTYVRSMSS